MTAPGVRVRVSVPPHPPICGHLSDTGPGSFSVVVLSLWHQHVVWLGSVAPGLVPILVDGIHSGSCASVSRAESQELCVLSRAEFKAVGESWA